MVSKHCILGQGQGAVNVVVQFLPGLGLSFMKAPGRLGVNSRPQHSDPGVSISVRFTFSILQSDILNKEMVYNPSIVLKKSNRGKEVHKLN